MKKFNRTYTKIALALSLILLVIWGILGAGASLAWFTDSTPVQKNLLDIGELDLVVSKRLDDGSYKEIDADTSVFDDEAIYEPGYVQVVYLKIENKGDVPFDYKTAVSVNDYTTATNVFGTTFELQDYLKFGVVTAESEDLLETMVADRLSAKNNANIDMSEMLDMPLNTYNTDTRSLAAEGSQNDTHFVALIVRMPEEVDNRANYRGDTVPEVKLGLVVKATQQGTPIS